MRIKYTFVEENGLRLQILLTTSQCIVNTIRTIYLGIQFRKGTTVHFRITITKSEEVRFSFRFLLMLHRRFAIRQHKCQCNVNLTTIDLCQPLR